MKINKLLVISMVFALSFFVFSKAEAQGEAALDANVTAEDLGVKDQHVLPGSPFYSLKEAWRGVKKTFTFSSEGKAKLELQYVSEKLLEAKKLAESGSADSGAVSDAIAGYEVQVQKFVDRTKDFSENEAGFDLKKQAAKLQFKQAVILDKLGEEASEEMFVKIKKAKERAQEIFSAGLANITKPEQLPGVYDDVIKSDSGSPFAGLKALEILKAIEASAPVAAREHLLEAREQIRAHFEEKLVQIPESERVGRMMEYLENMPGDETGRMAVLDDLKLQGQVPPEVLREMELMKVKIAERFNEKLKKLESPAAKDYLFKDLDEGDLEDVRILDDLATGSLDSEVRDEIENRHRDSLQKFREKFTDQQAQDAVGQAEKLFEEVRRSPDPKTFRLLEELRQSLTPEQEKFVRDAEEQGKQAVKERFEQEKEKYLERIQTINPEDFGYFDDFEKSLAPDLPPEFGQQLREAKENSAGIFEQRIRQIEKPEYVEEYKKYLEKQNPEDGIELKRQIPDLERQFEQRQRYFEKNRSQTEPQRQQPVMPNEETLKRPGTQFNRPQAENDMPTSPKDRGQNLENRPAPSFPARPEFKTPLPGDYRLPGEQPNLLKRDGFAPKGDVQGAFVEFDLLTIITLIF